jgi:hypothetical protein
MIERNRIRKMENIIDYEIKKYTRREGRHYRK